MKNLNIDKYMKYDAINEQTAVISEDPKERLKQYLDNEDFLEKLSAVLVDLEDGYETTHVDLQISGKDYGILSDDIIHIRVDKADVNNPKFVMWVMNEEFMYGDVDLELAANMLYQAGQKGNVFTAVGNVLGSLIGVGDAGDAGTDTESVAGIAGAIASIAKDKDIDPNIYFEKLAKHFTEKYGSLVNFLETEFSGSAEATALNVYRQKIDDSWTRGFNLPALLGDVALTVVTFGGGTVARTMFKGASAATKTLRYTGAASKTSNIAKGTGKVANIFNKFKTTWSKLPDAVQTSRVRKLIGQPLEYVTSPTSKSNSINKIIGSVEKTKNGGRIKWHDGTWGPYVANVAIDGGASLSARSFAMLMPNTATKLAAGAGIAANKGETSNIQSDASGLEMTGEILGWYDSLAADPTATVSQVKQTAPKALAEQLLDLKNGSGIWGNTTNQEELMMALIITSVTHKGANEIENEYNRLDPNAGGVYAVLKDELGGDEATIALKWWAGCMGIDDPDVTKAKARINVKPPKR